jgi:hypothetical protein
VVTAGTFQDLNFSTNGQLNGWTHTAGTSTFTCNQAGRYLVIYRAEGSHTALSLNILVTISLRGTLNGTEIAGSQSAFSSTILALTSTSIPITNSFIVNAAATNTLKIQFTATSSSSSISPAGAGTTSTSASITIIRLS